MLEIAEDCQYYVFDLFDENFISPEYKREMFRHNFEELRLRDNVQFFEGDSRQTLPEHFDDLPDMDLIFIDGGHSYEVCKNDWEHCKGLMRKGSACFFHDYNMSGVKRVVNEIPEDKYLIEIIEPPYSHTLHAKITLR